MPPTDYPRAFGSYVLLERLGQGGMSEVDLARRAVDETNFVRFLVIKRILAQHTGDDSLVRMFHDEARINAELHHENIASVYDFGQEGDEFFLAMEYVPGCDLRRVQRLLLRRGEHFPLRMALRIIAEVLAALEYAHGRVDTYGRSMNIVHRDVNPRNIMLSLRGEVKLIDFGVAKADNRSEHTVGHTLKGKFAYMAPEQIDATRPIDGRADLFAVGIVLHELLNGASPFAGLTEVQTMHRILSGQIPPPLSHPDHPIPDAVLNVYDRALQTNPDRRYRSAGDMRAALIAAAEELGGLPSPAELAEFLLDVDPDANSVSHRLELWREDGDASISRVSPPSETTTIPLRIGEASTDSLAGGTSSAEPSPPVRGRAIFAAATVGASVGIVLLLALAGGAWWLNRAPDTHAPSPAATPTAAPAPKPALPKPAVETPALPKPAVETPALARPAPARPPVPKPAAVAPRPESNPTASPPTHPAPQADPAPTPDPPTLQSAAESALPVNPPSAGPATPTSAPTISALSESTVTGFLNISSRPIGLELSIDGKAHGTTPARALQLPIGPHTVVVSNPSTGQSWTRQVEVKEGRSQLIRLGEGT